MSDTFRSAPTPPRLRLLLPVVITLLTAGCGLVDTAASSAAGAATEAQQAKDAKATEDRVKQQLDAAQQAAAQQREQADKESQ